MNVDPEAVIQRLAAQVGHLSAQLAMAQVALEAAQQKIAEQAQDAPEPEPAA